MRKYEPEMKFNPLSSPVQRFQVAETDFSERRGGSFAILHRSHEPNLLAIRPKACFDRGLSNGMFSRK
jgi:hypothetical protein